MGKTLEDKKAIVADLKSRLSEAKLAVVIDYQGLSVAQITNLRSRLREHGATCTVAKNTLMRIAVEGDENWSALQGLLSGTSAFIFAGEETMSASLKAYQAFQKESKKTELRGGVLDGEALSVDHVKALADLPTKDELYARIAGAIKAVPTKLAKSVNEVPASLARALKAVAEKEDEAA
ncbi:MAG: 50S ribosomal protein L10 [Coleofasciculaceae cyanobacterium RL_1_1]|nr:50S ribosomal protein L10 [Coleofasciculaceae cyanobacterium RL_1_1]